MALRCLLVDDSLPFQQAATSLLEREGVAVVGVASSITEAAIDERLALLGVPETTLAGLRELFQLCNQARYAPMRTSGELAAVIPRFESAIRELHKVKA